MGLVEDFDRKQKRKRFTRSRFIWRLKFSGIATLAMCLITLVTPIVAEVWDGKDYDRYTLTYMPRGYIEEYSEREEFCHSWLLPPGFALMHWLILIIIYLLILAYLFLGIAIIADIFMEAIEVITSQT